MLLEPLDFISRLCALIPPPRFHMLRYHGVLAGHSSDRAEIIPHEDEEPETLEPQLCLFEPYAAAPLQPPPRRHPWAWLLQRVFAIDLMTCPRCEGAMKLVTIDTDHRRPRQPPALTGAWSPQLELDFAA